MESVGGRGDRGWVVWRGGEWRWDCRWEGDRGWVVWRGGEWKWECRWEKG